MSYLILISYSSFKDVDAILVFKNDLEMIFEWMFLTLNTIRVLFADL